MTHDFYSYCDLYDYIIANQVEFNYLVLQILGTPKLYINEDKKNLLCSAAYQHLVQY